MLASFAPTSVPAPLPTIIEFALLAFALVPIAIESLPVIVEALPIAIALFIVLSFVPTTVMSLPNANTLFVYSSFACGSVPVAIFPILLLLPTEYELAAFMILGSPNAPEFSPLTILPVPIEIVLSASALAPIPIAIAFAPTALESLAFPLSEFIWKYLAPSELILFKVPMIVSSVLGVLPVCS
ncbi:Uncharacterised protein [Campylobacter geochelonis]|nr:Uncharacterised protein [Campylobacter geochelonis]